MGGVAQPRPPDAPAGSGGGPPSAGGPAGRAGAAGTAGWRTGARRGTVEAFDEERGLGAVRADDGRLLPFHCTALLDGTRQVPPGTPVAFTVAPGHRGALQAVGITAIC